MVSPIARIHGSRNHGKEKCTVLFTITPSDPLVKLLSVPETLSSAGLKVLVSEQGALKPEDRTNIH